MSASTVFGRGLLRGPGGPLGRLLGGGLDRASAASSAAGLAAAFFVVLLAVAFLAAFAAGGAASGSGATAVGGWRQSRPRAGRPGGSRHDGGPAWRSRCPALRVVSVLFSSTMWSCSLAAHRPAVARPCAPLGRGVGGPDPRQAFVGAGRGARMGRGRTRSADGIRLRSLARSGCGLPGPVRGEWVGHRDSDLVERPLCQPGHPWGLRRHEVSHATKRGQNVVGSYGRCSVPYDQGEYRTVGVGIGGRRALRPDHRAPGVERAAPVLHQPLDEDLVRRQQLRDRVLRPAPGRRRAARPARRSPRAGSRSPACGPRPPRRRRGRAAAPRRGQRAPRPGRRRGPRRSPRTRPRSPRPWARSSRTRPSGAGRTRRCRPWGSPRGAARARGPAGSRGGWRTAAGRAWRTAGAAAGRWARRRDRVVSGPRVSRPRPRGPGCAPAAPAWAG